MRADKSDSKHQSLILMIYCFWGKLNEFDHTENGAFLHGGLYASSVMKLLLLLSVTPRKWLEFGISKNTQGEWMPETSWLQQQGNLPLWDLLVILQRKLCVLQTCQEGTLSMKFRKNYHCGWNSLQFQVKAPDGSAKARKEVANLKQFNKWCSSSLEPTYPLAKILFWLY